MIHRLFEILFHREKEKPVNSERHDSFESDLDRREEFLMIRAEKLKKREYEYERLTLEQERAFEEKMKTLEEQKMVAEAWRPYIHERKPNTMQMRALADGISDTLLEAIDVLAKERMRQMSNQAIVAAEGSLKQAKPMWVSVGINMLLKDIMDAARLAERQEVRKASKAKQDAEVVPDKQKPREMMDLYNNPKLSV